LHPSTIYIPFNISNEVLHTKWSHTGYDIKWGPTGYDIKWGPTGYDIKWSTTGYDIKWSTGYDIKWGHWLWYKMGSHWLWCSSFYALCNNTS